MLEALDQAMDGMKMRMLEITEPALFLADKAFVQYRRAGDIKTNVLGDFFIGTHAAVSGLPVLTRDIQRYKNCFPSARLVASD